MKQAQVFFFFIMIPAMVFFSRPIQAQLPSPPIETRLSVSDMNPRTYETFSVTLTVITRNLDIHQQLDLDQLPDPDSLAFLTPFEAMPIQRESNGRETVIYRTYKAKVRAMHSGSITIAPRLRFTARRRIPSFFGNAFHDQQVQMDVPPLSVSILPLPDPPQDFSGAVGNFNVSISASPTNIVEGGLVTIITRIEGSGWLNDVQIPEILDQQGIKAYPINHTTAQPELNIFEQTLVIESNLIKAIPAISFWYFDTAADGYREMRFGPFLLNFIPDKPRVIQRFRPTLTPLSSPTGTATHLPELARNLKQKLATNANLRMRTREHTQARMAPASTSHPLFSIPEHTEIRLYAEFREWALVEYGRNRGWVPLVMLTAP